MRIHGPAMRTIRERSGLTVTQLAELAGMRQSHLSNIEAGRRQASEDLIVALARALKTELITIIEDPWDKAAS